MPDRSDDGRSLPPSVARELARLTNNPVRALLEQQEQTRRQMLEAMAVPSMSDQITAAIEQNRREQEDQLAQIRKLFERTSVQDQIRSIMDDFHRQERGALDEARRAFESSGREAIREAMASLDRVRAPLDALMDQVRFPTLDLEADALRALAEPQQGIRDAVDRLFAPAMSSAIEQLVRAGTPTADLFAGLGSATLGVRELLDQAAIDSAAAQHAAALVDRQLDAVGLFLGREDDLERPEGAPRAWPTSPGLSFEARLGLAMLLIAVLAFLQDFAANLAELQSRQQDEETAAVTTAQLKRIVELMERTTDQAARAAAQRRMLAVGPQPLTVRSRPGDGYKIGIAHPNQVVEQTGHEGRWLRIRYRDHNEQRDIEGWVLKQRLTRVSHPD